MTYNKGIIPKELQSMGDLQKPQTPPNNTDRSRDEKGRFKDEVSKTIVPGMKTCTHCKEVKKKEYFSKHKSKPDGLSYWCKVCLNKSSTARRIRLKDNEEFKEIRRKFQIKWYNENPLKTKAHRAVRSHRKELIKEACEECGATQPLHLHHPDYNQPLNVITLCRRCHTQIHRGVII